MIMNTNEWRKNMIDELLSRFGEDEEAEYEAAKTELETMTDEELWCELGTLRYEVKKDYKAELMDMLEDRGE